MLTVSITDPEHVHALPLLHIRRQNKRILVHFFTISRLEANSSCKCKLLDNVLLFYVSQMRCVGGRGP